MVQIIPRVIFKFPSTISAIQRVGVKRENDDHDRQPTFGTDHQLHTFAGDEIERFIYIGYLVKSRDWKDRTRIWPMGGTERTSCVLDRASRAVRSRSLRAAASV